MADNITTKSIEEFRSWFPEISDRLFTNFSVARVQITFENRFDGELEPGETRHTFLKTFTYNKDEK